MNIKLHHVGYVVKNIAEYEQSMIFVRKINEVYDPVQKAKLSIYDTGSHCMIELIEPQNEEAFTYNFLNKSGKSQYHHLCYVIDQDSLIDDLKQKLKLIPILGPIPAILFDNKMVYFFYSKNKEIIEILVDKP